jgi:hypothetical protein
VALFSMLFQGLNPAQLALFWMLITKNSYNQKGHYRIKRKSLNEYLESKKVIPVVKQSKPKKATSNFPKVKNHLGL